MAETEDKSNWLESSYLECPECGATVFESETGTFWDDEQKYCPECLTLCLIRVDDAGPDDPFAYVVTAEDMIQDIGQPRCDGATCTGGDEGGAACESWALEHAGKPCVPECPKFKAWKDDD